MSTEKSRQNNIKNELSFYIVYNIIVSCGSLFMPSSHILAWIKDILLCSGKRFTVRMVGDRGRTQSTRHMHHYGGKYSNVCISGLSMYRQLDFHLVWPQTFKIILCQKMITAAYQCTQSDLCYAVSYLPFRLNYSLQNFVDCACTQFTSEIWQIVEKS